MLYDPLLSNSLLRTDRSKLSDLLHLREQQVLSQLQLILQPLRRSHLLYRLQEAVLLLQF